MNDSRQLSLTLQRPPEAAPSLESSLQELGAALEPCPHAFFRARVEGCVITFYRSGKLLLQGPATAQWAPRLELDPGRRPGPPGPEEEGRRTIGSDESGKGDYFGPLVVAAVLLPSSAAALADQAGVRDCKTVEDRRCLQLGAWLEREFPVAIRELFPEDYNRRYLETGSNLNVLLAALHSEVIRELLPRLEGPGPRRILVDRFGPEERLARALGPLPPGTEFIQIPRAEVDPAVAAASIVARARFLEGLKACGEEAASDLPKGAGPPVLQAARRVAAIGGRALLGKVAKLHFRTTGQLGLP